MSFQRLTQERLYTTIPRFEDTAMPRQELTADADGVVEFDVPHGFKYAVSSHIDGLGASFQLVFDAVAEQRDVRLWNFPVFAYGKCRFGG